MLLASLCWLTGKAVAGWGWKVNYTRKINHFALMVIPLLFAPVMPYEPDWRTITMTLIVFVMTTQIFCEPIRARVPMVATAFASVDRPEDQPHTLLWIQTQAIASYLVLVVLFLSLRQLGVPELVAIVLFVTGVGDGLAEPIGVRFGRHRYRVPSLARDRVYHRSIEGSACVFVSAILAVVFVHDSLTSAQLIVMLLIVPIAFTITEAMSPHSWDAPFMYATGGAVIFATAGLVG